MLTEHACLLSWVEAKEQSKRMAEISPFRQTQMGHLQLLMKTYYLPFHSKNLLYPFLVDKNYDFWNAI